MIFQISAIEAEEVILLFSFKFETEMTLFMYYHERMLSIESN